jgi:hypothetical protein
LVTPTETTLVNLALASGLLAFALDLDEILPLPAAATGNTHASFSFRPHPESPEPLEHHAGQVQIDVVFVGRRGGKDVCFVVEAKSMAGPISKHKLLYPIYSLGPRVPADIPLVPVYLEAKYAKDQGYLFNVTECDAVDARDSATFLSDTHAVKTRRLRLALASG